jgi:hypothetical protein
MVGLIPLYACAVMERKTIEALPGFFKRTRWFLTNRSDLARQIAYMQEGSDDRSRALLAIPSKERLLRVLRYLLDENEFLSPHGIRSVSRVHREKPYTFGVNGGEYRVDYVPAESNTGLFGGNSNWRGPIWFPVNFLLVEALERYHHFYGDALKVECPTGSGNLLTLKEVAAEIARRLGSLFLPDARGHRPFTGADPLFGDDPRWRELVLFHEYFDGDTGRGVGASHQTGWTALAIPCIEDTVRTRSAGTAVPAVAPRHGREGAPAREEGPGRADAAVSRWE